MKKIVWLLIIFAVLQNNSFAQSSKVKPIKLEAYKSIDTPARDEVSGIVKSRKFNDTYWVHGDSGTKNHIYAINALGEIKSNDKNYGGAKIKGVKNKDWEDIALGEEGTLILADFGNNCNCREDLKILIVVEPDLDSNEAELIEEYQIRYPKREGVISLFVEENYNAEAVFMKQGIIYVITKNSPAGDAFLFQLVNPSSNKTNILVKVESFNFLGLVTAADISPNETKLAVLTYNGIWLFDQIEGKGIFEGNKFWQPIKGVEQVESITFSGEYLIITEENGELYRIKISEIPSFTRN